MSEQRYVEMAKGDENLTESEGWRGQKESEG